MTEGYEERDLEEDFKELLDDIYLLDEGKKFLKSRLGLYLLDCALADEESARKQWVDVDPNDAEKIRSLQLQAKVPNLVFGWVHDAMRRGSDAEAILEQESNNA